MRNPYRPYYNQNHQSIFINRQFPHAIQRLSHQTTSRKPPSARNSSQKSNLESIFPIQTVGTSRPLPSQRLSQLKKSPKPKSIRQHLNITKTLLTSLYNKLVITIGHQQVSCLCLLDISAAFDTIDHSILINRLSSLFGISGLALSRMKS